MDSSSDTLSTPFAAAPTAARRLRTADHRFYTWACVAAFAVVFAGFARTYSSNQHRTNAEETSLT